jgi:hypothetical protein
MLNNPVDNLKPIWITKDIDIAYKLKEKNIPVVTRKSIRGVWYVLRSTNIC